MRSIICKICIFCTAQISKFQQNASNFFCYFKNDFFNISQDFSKFAICMLKFDENVSELRECFQKMENDMEICRIVCQMMRKKFPEIFDTE